MKELKRQLQILIDRAEEQKALAMIQGRTSDIREADGQIQAFKLIRLLINTNSKIV